MNLLQKFRGSMILTLCTALTLPYQSTATLCDGYIEPCQESACEPFYYSEPCQVPCQFIQPCQPIQPRKRYLGLIGLGAVIVGLAGGAIGYAIGNNTHCHKKRQCSICPSTSASCDCDLENHLFTFNIAVLDFEVQFEKLPSPIAAPVEENIIITVFVTAPNGFTYEGTTQIFPLEPYVTSTMDLAGSVQLCPQCFGAYQIGFNVFFPPNFGVTGFTIFDTAFDVLDGQTLVGGSTTSAPIVYPNNSRPVTQAQVILGEYIVVNNNCNNQSCRQCD